MPHIASASFWKSYDRLLPAIRTAADRNFQILKLNPRHPSLHFKRVGKLWSVRVTSDVRALAILDGETHVWFWIGTHDDYERLIQRR